MIHRKSLIAAVLACCAGLALAVALQNIPLAVTPLPESALHREEGRPAPAAQLFIGPESQVALELFRGAPVLLHFWATWCAPCVAELPSLAALEKRGAGRLKVIALSVDTDGFEKIEPFLLAREIAHPQVYWDRGMAAFRDFGVRGLPTTVLIGRDGRIIARAEGAANWMDENTLSALDALLEEKF